MLKFPNPNCLYCRANLLLCILFILTYVVCTTNVSAQTDSLTVVKKKRVVERAFGIDATFINNFLPLDNNIGSTGAYLFQYIKYRENRRYTKHALDFDIRGVFELNEDEVDRNDASIFIAYKLNNGKSKPIIKNGNLMYGSELAFSYFFSQNTNEDPNDFSGESIVKNRFRRFAVLPGINIGFEYKITKRIFLFTEASFLLDFTVGIEKFESEFDTRQNFTNLQFGISENFRLPRTIYLFYKF